MSENKQPLEESQGQSFVVGAAIGAVVGGIAAMLLTPKTGKEMRALAREYAKEWENEAGDFAVEAKQIIGALKDALEEGTDQVAQKAPEIAAQTVQKASQAAEIVEDSYTNSRDTVSEMVETFRSQWQELEEEHQAKQATSRFRGVSRTWENGDSDSSEDKENTAYVEELNDQAQAAAVASRPTLAQYRQAARTKTEPKQDDKKPETPKASSAKPASTATKASDDAKKPAKKTTGRKLLFRKTK